MGARGDPFSFHREVGTEAFLQLLEADGNGRLFLAVVGIEEKIATGSIAQKQVGSKTASNLQSQALGNWKIFQAIFFVPDSRKLLAFAIA